MTWMFCNRIIKTNFIASTFTLNIFTVTLIISSAVCSHLLLVSFVSLQYFCGCISKNNISPRNASYCFIYVSHIRKFHLLIVQNIQHKRDLRICSKMFLGYLKVNYIKMFRILSIISLEVILCFHSNIHWITSTEGII